MTNYLATLAPPPPALPADLVGRTVWLRFRYVVPDPRSPQGPRINSYSGDYQGTIAAAPAGGQVLIASPIMSIDAAWPGATDGCLFFEQPDYPGPSPSPAAPRIVGFALQP